MFGETLHRLQYDGVCDAISNTSFLSFSNWIRKTADNYNKQFTSYGLPMRTASFCEKVDTILADYRDYHAALRELGYDMTDRYYLLPKDFRNAHDKVMEELKSHREKIAEEKKRKQAMAVSRILAHAKELIDFNAASDCAGVFKSKNLVICIPQSAKEIEEEGKHMHHCVASYVPRVARGETCIFFVRQLSEPDKSYVTLEWNDGIVQCRAAHNDRPSDEVMAFVNAFDIKLKKQGITTKKLATFTSARAKQEAKAS